MNNIINLPASKSIGARFLTASYFAGTLNECQRFDDCDDLKVIQAALKALANSVSERHGDSSEKTVLDVHASGTAFRFMAAAAASTPGAAVRLTGTSRLCSRPMAPLIEVLRNAGATINALGENGTGPYEIYGSRLRGGDFEIRGDVSSQFISALMLASPSWDGGMRLRFTTPLVSRPYAEMTAKVMRDFGIEVDLSEHGVEVREGKYMAPEHYTVEADWSAAGFIYEAAAFKLNPVVIARLAAPDKSMQGDAATAEIFSYLGVASRYGLTEKDCDNIYNIHGLPEETSGNGEYAVIQRYYELPDELELDMTHYPDMVPALALACAFNGCRFRFTGVRNLRMKESDRLEAMKREMEKYGYPVKTGDDFIEWQGGVWSHDRDFVIDTYDDHRIAMAFAIGALRKFVVRIADPDVVDKSFARFWEQLPKLGLECRREGNVMIVEYPKSEWHL